MSIYQVLQLLMASSLASKIVAQNEEFAFLLKCLDPNDEAALYLTTYT